MELNNRPEENEYAERYIPLIAALPQQNPQDVLTENWNDSLAFWKSVPEEKWAYRYASGKWTVREVLLHCLDTERIFIYRALCIARGEESNLPGFEENDYARKYDLDMRNTSLLLEEFELVRKSFVSLYAGISEWDMKRIGSANHNPISPRAAAFLVAAHEKHHRNVVQERYLNQ